ncbi:MAG: hypothetical protein AAGF01_09345 [Cyanobacteria bacterium P01_G01_bin.38]
MTALVVMLGGSLLPFEMSHVDIAQAQPRIVLRRVEPAAIAAQIYAQYPDFPTESTYTLQRSGDVAVDDTLVSRLIRYHLYVKNRPPNFRLDWKLTIADYLDAFELIRASLYPSADVLSENPMEGDKAAVQSMTRQQRNQLSQALFDLFIGRDSEADTESAAPTSVPSEGENEQTSPSADDLLP